MQGYKESCPAGNSPRKGEKNHPKTYSTWQPSTMKKKTDDIESYSEEDSSTESKALFAVHEDPKTSVDMAEVNLEASYKVSSDIEEDDITNRSFNAEFLKNSPLVLNRLNEMIGVTLS
jgi:hypothetical protein